MTIASNISFRNNTSWVSLLNLIYPVGSIYHSWSGTSPASSLGGTWTQIKDTFLRPASSAGSTGGANSHSHVYGVSSYDYWSTVVGALIYNGSSSQWIDVSGKQISSNKTVTVNSSLNNASTSRQMGQYGGTTYTTSSSTIPAYTTCYCWRRTA